MAKTADSKPVVKGSGKKIRRVGINRQMKGTIHRGEAAVTVQTSGRCSANASAYDITLALAEKKGYKIGNVGIGLGVADDSSTVWLYLEESTTDNIVPIRWNEKNHTYSFSIVHAFKELPTLAPSARRHVPMTATVDDEGVECLAIDLAVSLVKAERTRKKAVDPGTAKAAAK